MWKVQSVVCTDERATRLPAWSVHTLSNCRFPHLGGKCSQTNTSQVSCHVVACEILKLQYLQCVSLHCPKTHQSGIALSLKCMQRHLAVSRPPCRRAYLLLSFSASTFVYDSNSHGCWCVLIGTAVGRLAQLGYCAGAFAAVLKLPKEVLA